MSLYSDTRMPDIVTKLSYFIYILGSYKGLALVKSTYRDSLTQYDLDPNISNDLFGQGTDALQSKLLILLTEIEEIIQEARDEINKLNPREHRDSIDIFKLSP